MFLSYSLYLLGNYLKAVEECQFSYPYASLLHNDTPRGVSFFDVGEYHDGLTKENFLFLRAELPTTAIK